MCYNITVNNDVFLIIAAIIILLFAIFSFFRELSRYKVARNIASLLVRLSTSILLAFMIITIWIGLKVFDVANPAGITNIWMLFWFSEFMIAISIAILAFVEIKYFKVNERYPEKVRITAKDIEDIISKHKEDKTD